MLPPPSKYYPQSCISKSTNFIEPKTPASRFKVNGNPQGNKMVFPSEMKVVSPLVEFGNATRNIGFGGSRKFKVVTRDGASSRQHAAISRNGGSGSKLKASNPNDNLEESTKVADFVQKFTNIVESGDITARLKPKFNLNQP
jgi:hypothetical protein